MTDSENKEIIILSNKGLQGLPRVHLTNPGGLDYLGDPQSLRKKDPVSYAHYISTLRDKKPGEDDL